MEKRDLAYYNDELKKLIKEANKDGFEIDFGLKGVEFLPMEEEKIAKVYRILSLSKNANEFISTEITSLKFNCILEDLASNRCIPIECRLTSKDTRFVYCIENEEILLLDFDNSQYGGLYGYVDLTYLNMYKEELLNAVKSKLLGIDFGIKDIKSL